MSYPSSNSVVVLLPSNNVSYTESKDSGCELNLIPSNVKNVENNNNLKEMRIPFDQSKFLNSMVSIFYHTPLPICKTRPEKRKSKLAKALKSYNAKKARKTVMSQTMFQEIDQNLSTSKVEAQNCSEDFSNPNKIFNKSQEDYKSVTSDIERTKAGGLPCNACTPIKKVCACPSTTRNTICQEAIIPKLSEIFPKAALPNYGPQIPLDDAYWQQIEKDCKKIKRKLPKDLGNPVGLITSTVLIKEHGENTQNLRFATYLKAMALIYIQDISLWHSYDMDTLMKEGKDLIMIPSENTINAAQNDVYSSIELSVPRRFQFLEYEFHIELQDFDTWIWDLKKNVHAALKKFFRTRRFCLIQFRHLYLLIWKEKSKYFILDFNGRDPGTLATQPEKGLTAMLLCVKQLRNVVHLICNMSDLDEEEAFLIREMFYAEVLSPEGYIFSHDISRQHEYKIINENYAYLASKLHLTLNPAVPLRNRSALTVALATMLATKIDHPATWNSKMLDQLICYGVDLCRRCWASCLNCKEPINLEDFPHCMHIGQFLVSYELEPQVYTGKWKCRPLLKYHEFRFVLKRALDKHNYLIFQINNQMYAIWKKHNFYYLLDPYLHYICGAANGEESELAKQKKASIRMLRNIDTFINVFQHILLQSNRCSIFYIHTLKINSIIESWNCAQPVEVPIASEDFPSLNEYICFKEHYPTCLEELGQSSDYEEDIVSHVSSISSVETSLTMVEEEEGEDIVPAEEIDTEKDTSKLTQTMAGSRSGRAKQKKKIKYSKEDDKNKREKLGRNVLAKENTAEESAVEKAQRTQPFTMQESMQQNDPNVIKNTQKVKQQDATAFPVGKSIENVRTGEQSKIDVASKENDISRHRIKGSVLSAQQMKKLRKVRVKKDINLNEAQNKETESELFRKQILIEDLKKAEEFQKQIGNELSDDSTNKKAKKVSIEDYIKLEDTYKVVQHRDSKLVTKAKARTVSTMRLIFNLSKKINGPHTYVAVNEPHKEWPQKDNNYETPFLNKPCFGAKPKNLIIANSKTGTYASICNILRAAIRCADRTMITTPMGNFVIFRGHGQMSQLFFLYHGCTCHLNRFRYLDISCGTAGLTPFYSLHSIIRYITEQPIKRCTITVNTEESNVICNACLQEKWCM